MVRTLAPDEVIVRDGTEYVPNGGVVPRLSGDLRPLMPTLGLREYWYPALGANRVKKNRPLVYKYDDLYKASRRVALKAALQG